MRTAIFVYQTTPIHISTCESDLELSGMNADTVSLSEGNNVRMLEPGIYKIVSGLDVGVIGDNAAFDVVTTTHTKTNDPSLPPSRATTNLASFDQSAMNVFLAVPEAKEVPNP
jgi:hypothetical protein